MTTDRDRLAADLHSEVPVMPLRNENEDAWLEWYDEYADRLIALGWTRLDEERLARALIPVLQPVMDDLGIPNYRGEWSDAVAAAIAKAYREDE